MLRTTLVEQLKKALLDSAELIEGAETQIIEMALADFSRYRPQTKLGTFLLTANQMLYPAPDNILDVKTVLYGQSQRAQNPWESGYPRNLPRVSVITGDDDKKWLQLSHYPSHSVVMSCGRDFSYTYYASRVLTGESVSIETQDEPLVLLRCLAEAVKYIAVHQLNKTVSVRNSIGGEAKNGTPAAIHEQLMLQFERQIRHA